MSLSGKFGDLPSLDDSSGTASFSDSADVDVLVVSKDLSNFNFLFEFRFSPVNFLSNSSSVDLNFSNMSFLLSEIKKMDLGMSNNSYNCGVFLYSVKISRNRVLVRVGKGPSLSILSESLLLL